MVLRARRWPRSGNLARVQRERLEAELAVRHRRSDSSGRPRAAAWAAGRVLRSRAAAAAVRGATVLGRRHADLVEEEAGEIALRREAELGGDLGDLAAPGGEARDRRLDAQHVEIRARREAGADLEKIVEARAREADLARELVHVELLVRPRAEQRDRAADARVLEA